MNALSCVVVKYFVSSIIIMSKCRYYSIKVMWYRFSLYFVVYFIKL